MSVRAAIGRWVACGVLAGVVALAMSCGREDAPEQARDRAPSPSPVPAMMRTATPTPTVTLSTLNCSILGTCSSTPTATPPTPPPTRTPTAYPGSTRFCAFFGDCPPTPTATATAAPPPTQSVGPTRSPSPSPSSGSAPTAAQLRRALLTDQEVGSGWAEVEAGALTRERNPAFFAEFVNLVADEYLAVELHDARNGAAEFLALRMIADRKFDKLDKLTPSGPGQDRTRHRYEFVSDGKRQYGELVAWRQGSVVVAMQIEGPRASTCVCDHARRQDEKVRAAGR